MKVKITPQKARELMAKNTRNRRLSRKLTEKYAADMKAGRWPYNGDPIRVSDKDVLLDGQHRLQAVIDSDTTIEAELITGLPDDVSMTIDGGRKRSPSDVLNMLDGASMLTTTVAACARAALNYLTGYSLHTMQSTPAIVTFVHNHEDVARYAKLAREADRIVTPSALGAVMFLGTRAATMDKRALQFVEPLKHGEGLLSGDPRLACRNAFINARMRNGVVAKAIDPRWAFITVTQCWNAFVTGREIQYTKVYAIKDGKTVYPDILGAPRFGAGIESLDGEVKLHARQKLVSLDASVEKPAAMPQQVRRNPRLVRKGRQ